MQFTTKSAKVFGSDRPDVPLMAGLVVPGSEDAEWVPKIDPDYHFAGDNLSVVLTFLKDAWTNGPTEGIQFIGPTGSGKSSLIEQICARLDVPLISLTAHGRMEVPDLISTMVAANGTTLTVDGPLTMAMRNGYVFVLNEVDLLDPSTTTGLNDILERGFLVVPNTNELVRAAPGFAFVVTSNTAGGGDEMGVHVGTQVQNLAFRDRFLKVYVDYMDAAAEEAMLLRAFPSLDHQAAETFVKTANLIRDAFKAGTGMDVTMSTRVLKRWIRLTTAYASMTARGKTPVHFAVDIALANGTSQEVSQSIHTMVEQTFGVGATMPAAAGG